jgi:hypothetical protein
LLRFVTGLKSLFGNSAFALQGLALGGHLVESKEPAGSRRYKKQRKSELPHKL